MCPVTSVSVQLLGSCKLLTDFGVPFPSVLGYLVLSTQPCLEPFALLFNSQVPFWLLLTAGLAEDQIQISTSVQQNKLFLCRPLKALCVRPCGPYGDFVTIPPRQGGGHLVLDKLPEAQRIRQPGKVTVKLRVF